MVGGEAILVGPEPGTDHQHGRTGRSQHIGHQSPDQQKEHVPARGGFPFDSDVDSAGNDEQ